MAMDPMVAAEMRALAEKTRQLEQWVHLLVAVQSTRMTLESVQGRIKHGMAEAVRQGQRYEAPEELKSMLDQASRSYEQAARAFMVLVAQQAQQIAEAQGQVSLIKGVPH